MRAPDDYTEQDHQDWVKAQVEYETQMHGPLCTTETTKITATDEKPKTTDGSESTITKSSGVAQIADTLTKLSETVTKLFNVPTAAKEQEPWDNPTMVDRLRIKWYKRFRQEDWEAVQISLKHYQPQLNEHERDYLAVPLIKLCRLFKS